MIRYALKRRGLTFGAGALAAGLLSGCQGMGTQLVGPAGGRAEPVHGTGMAPASPAFAQVAAGQALPANAARAPINGSGGIVYPVG